MDPRPKPLTRNPGAFRAGRISCAGTLVGSSVLAVVLLSGQLRLYLDVPHEHSLALSPPLAYDPEHAEEIKALMEGAGRSHSGCQGDGLTGELGIARVVEAALYTDWESEEVLAYRLWLQEQLAACSAAGTARDTLKWQSQSDPPCED